MDAFGAPINQLPDNSSRGLTNSFSDIPSQNVDDMLQSTRVQPRQIGTGTMRGTQKVLNNDGSYITIGQIGDTSEFGIAFYDPAANLISKSNGMTDYKYDLSTNKNYYQNGKLPDGSYGAIFVKSGVNVQDVFS